MPPSLRYFAGGDRSIRGYAYREVGPRTPKPDKYALGAKNLVIGSAEYEHYFNGGPWGAAVFVDTGSALTTPSTCTPASASACAGNRRWARCALTWRMA